MFGKKHLVLSGQWSLMQKKNQFLNPKKLWLPRPPEFVQAKKLNFGIIGSTIKMSKLFKKSIWVFGQESLVPKISIRGQKQSLETSKGLPKREIIFQNR